MRILMIAPEPFLAPRGTPLSIYQRLRSLTSLGHSVDLLTYHLGTDVQIPGVAIRRLPRIPFIERIGIGPSLPKLLLDVMLFLKAVMMLVRNRYDIIHSHEEAAFFSMFLGALFRTRHLYDMHSSLPRQLAASPNGYYRSFAWLFRLLERWVLRTCDAVITIDPQLDAYVREVNPVAKQVMIENLSIQTSGSDDGESVAQLRERLGLQDKFPIVYTGSFEHYQGLGLLLESAQRVHDQHPEIVFVLVGGDSQQVLIWQDRARDCQLNGSVQFVGSVPVNDIPKYLEMAEILISPRVEGTAVPLKVYSYLQAGKPIVATNVAGHTMVLDRATAILVEPTGDSLADGLLQLIGDSELRRILGDQAKKVAEEKYSLTSYMAKLAWIYRAVQDVQCPADLPVYPQQN